MALVSMKEMLITAKEGKYAVGQFNINNLEWTQAILQAAEEEKSPVILGVSEGAAKYMGGFVSVVHIVKGLMASYGTTVPVAIHLDHGSSFDKCKEAIDAGFTSVMIDASHHPFEENVETTKQVVEYAHARNVSVEAELGTVGGEEDGVIGGIIYADPQECKAIASLGVDMLAAGIGNIHGKYPANWKGLNFEVLAEIQNQCGSIPLVLHGGSGIPTEKIKKSIWQKI